MATIKQKLALSRIIENRGNISKSMLEVGYSENSARNPKNLTDSDGFRELLEENGLTDDFLIKALKEDIDNKPQDRKPELELAFKVSGRLREKNDGNRTNIFNYFESDQIRRIAARVLDGDSTSEEKPHRLSDSNEL